MKSWLRWTAIAAASFAALIVIALVGVLAASQIILDRTYPKRPGTVHAAATAGAVAQGRYLADVTGCTGCHGADLTGRRIGDVPGSTVYASNLTIALKILSDADIDRVVRQGVLPNGRSVVVMPSRAYANLRDDEMASIIAYLRSLHPRGTETPPLRFGLMVRAGFVGGLFRTEAEALNDARTPLDLGARYARGRHLTQIVCAQCHGADLAGKPNDPAMQTPDLLVVEAYDHADFLTLLHTGKALGNREVGLMSEVARSNFSLLNAEDADAIYDYLRARASAIIARTSRR